MGCAYSYEPSPSKKLGINKNNSFKNNAVSPTDDVITGMVEKDESIFDSMKYDNELDEEKMKLLILGAAESGKSTIFKQVKLKYGVKYSERQRKKVIPIIHKNIIHFMKSLSDAAIQLKLSDSVLAKEELQQIRQLDDSDKLDERIADMMKILWKDPGIQQVWNRRNEFQIIDSTLYFIKKLKTVAMAIYIPDQDDMLFLRVKTTSIVTEKYMIDGTPFEIYDVAGQRTSRKKWIHCFDNVDAIIFVAAISEYDQKIFEDGTTNRMVSKLLKTCIMRCMSEFIYVRVNVCVR